MKRFAILGVMVLAIALIAIPAFAEVQNVKVSGDVNSAGVYRNHYTLLSSNQNSPGTSDNNNFLFTQARVRVDADLTDNVMATVRLLTEYDWNTEDNTAGDGDNLDLDLAYVTLKEAFYSPLSVSVGRQTLRYGNAFVIGDPDTNTTSKDGNLTARDLSLRKSFDAIKAVLDYNPLTVDIFYAKIDETNTSMDDADLYGINAAYDIGTYNAKVEAYWLFNRNDDETAPSPSADAFTLGQEIHTFGARGVITPIENLNLLGEVAFQRGDFDKHSATKRDQDAYAYQVAGDYTFANVAWSPMVKLGWTFYSGETTSNDGDHEAWIPLYEDQSHGVVANYILGGVNGGQNSNAGILNVGAKASPIKDLTVSIDYYNYWLDEKLVTSANTTPSGALGWYNLTESSYYMKPDDDLGYEIDLALNYDYTEDVKMGLSAGWFVPGDALEGVYNSYKNDETAIQVLATLDVAF